MPRCGARNLELSRHLDRVDIHADGRVVMRTHKLGIFEGAAALLARPAPSAPTAGGPPAARPIRPRGPRRNRPDRPLGSGSGPLHELTTGAHPAPSENLDPRWFWEDVFELPSQMCWSQENAEEVARLRAQGWTMERLARHFRRSLPTIRRALRIASTQGQTTSEAGAQAEPSAEPDR
jgi:hypothetical protein